LKEEGGLPFDESELGFFLNLAGVRQLKAELSDVISRDEKAQNFFKKSSFHLGFHLLQ
jgi:hypothetical protein